VEILFKKLYEPMDKDATLGFKTRIASLLEKAITLYGKDSPDIWLKYVSIMMELGDIGNASRIHWRALKTLKPSKQSDYLLVYSEQQFGTEKH